MPGVKKLSVLFCSLVLFLLLSSFAVRNSDRKTRSLVLRFQIVIFIESLLSLGSLFIWRNLSQLYPAQQAGHHDATGKQSAARRGILPIRRPSLYKGRFHVIWKCVLFTVLLSAQLCYPLGVTLISAEPYKIVLFSYICMGIHLLLSTNISLWFLISAICRKIFCPKKNSDREWMTLFKVCVVVFVSGIFAFTAVSRAFHGPIIKKVNIPISNLPKVFDSMRIVQISDIHLGPTVGKSQLQRAVELTNSLNPDLVSITGDLVDAPVSYLSEAVLPLNQLNPQYGTYFVTGNHEYYTGDVDAWIVYLKTLGVKCLHNENIKIRHQVQDKDFFYLVGTDDVQGETFKYGDHGFKLDKALQGTDQQHAIILLAHRPSAAYSALSADKGIKLVLSGHTHGGQLFPAIVWVYFLNPYFIGLYQYSATSYVYVSSGTFYWGIPMRMFSTQEVTLITLHSA